VDGWKMPPFMGLTTWAAFIEGKQAEAMVAGDLVVFEDEVNAVMSAALDAGLSVTALGARAKPRRSLAASRRRWTCRRQ
jgi:hypothetical protein